MTRRWRCFGAVVVACASACHIRRAAEPRPRFGDSPALPARLTYTFGVPPARTADSLFAAYRPLLDVLSAGRAYTLRFQTAGDDTHYHRRLRSNDFDFALVTPDDAIAAEEWNYRIVAKTGERDMIQGMLIVGSDSGIRKTSQLREKKICFSSADDLAGTLMVKFDMRARGLDADHDAIPVYVGRHESCVIHVMFGMAAAGGISAGLWNLMQADNPQIPNTLRPLWRTERLPGLAVVAREGVPPGDVREVSSGLLGLRASPEGAGMLRRIGVSGFERITAASYDPVWQFLQEYRRPAASRRGGRR